MDCVAAALLVNMLAEAGGIGMDKLVTDLFVRHTAQILLLAVLLSLPLVSLGADIYFLMGKSGSDPKHAIEYFEVLSIPYQDALSPFAVIGTSVVPIVFSTVCFTILPGSPQAASTTLNHVGHAALALSVVGLVMGAVTLVLFASDPTNFSYVVGAVEKQTAVRGLIGSFSAFDVLYFTQLLGVRK